MGFTAFSAFKETLQGSRLAGSGVSWSQVGDDFW